MSSKTEALVRDLASLFVKYRLSDWAPILDELEHRGGSDKLVDGIRRHAEDARSATAAPSGATRKLVGKTGRSGAAKPKMAPQLELGPRFTGPHAVTVEQLCQALVSKRSLSTLRSLKAVYATLGVKSVGGSRREALIANLTKHLDQLDSVSFEKALRNVAREEERNAPGSVADYDRWFQLITARKP